MFNLTDLIVVVFFLYFMYAGWTHGVLKILSAPLAFVISIGLAFVHYQRTHNIVLSLLISLVGPLLLKWLFSFLISLLDKAAGDKEEGPSVLSRVMGILINSSWNGGLLLLSLFCLALLPFDLQGLKQIKANIRESLSFHWVTDQIPGYKELEPATQGVLAGFQDRQAMEQAVGGLRESEDFQDIMQDPRVKALLEDEEVQNDIKKKDILGLMNHPRFIEIMDDPELIKKFIKIYIKAQEGQGQAQPQANPPEDMETSNTGGGLVQTEVY